MKSFAKIITLAAVFTLSAGILTGCGTKKPEAADPATTTEQTPEKNVSDEKDDLYYEPAEKAIADRKKEAEETGTYE